MKTIHITHPHAATAIYAANNRYTGQHWGPYASRMYALKHGVPMRLYVIACQLSAVSKSQQERG